MAMKNLKLFSILSDFAYEYGFAIYPGLNNDIVMFTHSLELSIDVFMKINKIIEHHNDNTIFDNHFKATIFTSKNRIAIKFTPL